MPEYYKPPQREIDEFNELLTELPDHLFDAEHVAILAGDFWRHSAAGKTLKVGVPGMGVDFTEVAVPPLESSKPAKAPVDAAPQPSEPEPLPPGRYVAAVPPQVEAKRREFMEIHGGGGAKIVSDGGDIGTSRVFRGD